MSEAQFNKALEIVNSFPTDGPVQTNYNVKLEMYKYFKQATIGDVNVDRPGFFDFEGKYKWESWDSVKGTPKEVCYRKYVELLIKLLKDSGHPEGKKHLAELEALEPLDSPVEALELLDPEDVALKPLDPELDVLEPLDSEPETKSPA